MAEKRRYSSDSSDEDASSPRIPFKRSRNSTDEFSNPEIHTSDNNEEESKGNDHSDSRYSSGNSTHWKKVDLSQSSSSSDEDDEKEGRCFSSSFQSRVETLMKPATEAKFENSKIQRMLSMMGHHKGEGLGKYGQGRVAPVELSTQRGRQGLGFTVEGLEAATLEWDSTHEVVQVQEEIAWLEEKHHTALDSHTLASWVKEGPIKLIIDDETHFCDPEVLNNVLTSKTVFDRLPQAEMRKARMRANPFETIRGGIFLNRAAMKMANMDAVFDFMFTKPVDEANKSLVGDELLYFADVCAGPGGFSEYVLWRKKWEAKGFGFTLKKINDFKLSEFLAGPCESFETHYGVNGLNGDGDVCNPENIKEFTSYVHDRTSFSVHNKASSGAFHGVSGVHFMMADGGFSVESQENIQEILSKQLYLCQFLVALSIVRTKGHFVCKVFDLFTPFSIGLIYLLYKSFKKISIHKPNSSRPANSERYVICKWKREDCDPIREYLFSVNEKYIKLRKQKLDVVEIVPLDVMKEDTDFLNYITESNNSLGDRQVVNLVKIAAFCKDTNLVELRQAQLKSDCLEYWKVPDIPRKVPKNSYPNEMIDELLGGNVGWMTTPETILNKATLKECITSAHDWKCFVVSSTEIDPKLTFYLGLGQGKVFSLQPKSKGSLKWNQLVDFKLELSPGTLILGETLQEHRGEGRSQQRVKALHIVDAFFLGGKDLRNVHLKDRNAMCVKFAEAMKKPLQIEHTPIRTKSLLRLTDLKDIFPSLKKKLMKSSSGMERLAYDLEIEDKYIIPSGIMFIRETKDPWVKTVRGSSFCWVNAASGHVRKDFPPDSIADLKFCFERRLMWRWKEDLSRVENLSLEECESPLGLNNLSNVLPTSHLTEHIRQVWSYQPVQHRQPKTPHGTSAHAGLGTPHH